MGLFAKASSMFSRLGSLATSSGRNAAFAKGLGPKASKNALNNLLFQAPGILATLVLPGSPAEKMENLAWNVGAYYLTMGMNSGWRQAAWGIALSAAPFAGDIVKGAASTYRGQLESRTSAIVPFTHNTMNMDQAFASMQYARSRMGEAYSMVGNEASYMAARYLQR